MSYRKEEEMKLREQGPTPKFDLFIEKIRMRGDSVGKWISENQMKSAFLVLLLSPVWIMVIGFWSIAVGAFKASLGAVSALSSYLTYENGDQ